jgi:flagellar basal body-associated protein FliL
MRIPQKKSNKRLKIIVIASIAVLVIAGSIVAYLYFSNKPDDTQNGINYNPPTQDEKSTGDTIKQQGSTGSDPASQPTPPTAPTETRSTVGMDISALNQTSGVLYVRTLIQTATASGACSLSMTGPAGKTYTDTANIQAGPSSSTCKGFDVPVSSLSSGTWSVTVSFQNDTLKGSSTKDVAIQ